MGPPSHASRAVSGTVVLLDRGDNAAEFQGKDKNSPKIHILLLSSQIYRERESQRDRQMDRMHKHNVMLKCVYKFIL